MAIAIGDTASEHVQFRLPRFLDGKFGIPFSTIAKATKPFVTTVSAIGVTYEQNNPLVIFCRPSAIIKYRYIRMLYDLGKLRLRLLPNQEMQTIAVLHTFVLRFHVRHKLFERRILVSSEGNWNALRYVDSISGGLEANGRDGI